MHMFTFYTNRAEEQFQKEIAEPLNQKFPDVQLRYCRARYGDEPNKWKKEGSVPDINLVSSIETKKLIDMTFVLTCEK